jgi:NitT/TauT family transport system permease protein
MKLFQIEGDVSSKQSTIIGIVGFVLLLLLWYLASAYGKIANSILPSPLAVITSFGDLFKGNLIGNALFSIKLNLLGYLEAVVISVVLGFAMGLIPDVRSLISKYFDAFRFLPLPAISGIFVALFGMEISMKIHFLSFGIMLYLIPVVVQRIDEVETIHKQTITTLGASKWQKIKHLYFPYAMSKISDDIRVLVAISWTYIVIVELYNKEGGLGGMIFESARQSQTAQIYALVLLIILFGYFQDRIFRFLDKILFPFKHEGQTKRSITRKLKSLIIKENETIQ